MNKNIKLVEKLEILQDSLAVIDLLKVPKASSRYGTEFLVKKLENIKIKMYQEKGHVLPHVHIDYANQYHVASFSIDPSCKIQGMIDKKYESEIIDWITTNKELLLKIWTEAQKGDNPNNLITELVGSNS